MLGLALLVTLAGLSQRAEAVPLSPGDVVLGLASSLDGTPEGELRHFSAAGSLLGTLVTTSGSFEETGMCFDAAGNLYTTNFEAHSVSKFNGAGALLNASWLSVGTSTPNSCAFDGAGHLYIGLSDADDTGFGGGKLLKVDLAGTVQATFTTTPEIRGTDWVDLAADKCTIYYTSQGGSIKKFNVCTNAPRPDFCTACDDGAGGATSGSLMDLRILPDGGVLVADFGAGVVRRYDASSVQVMSYAAEDAYGLFFPWSLALAPGGASFWVADNITGDVFQFDLASGALLSQFVGGDCDDVFSACAVTGLAVVGEPRVGATAPATTTTVTAHITAANKVYNATTAATITSCTLTGVVGTDDVSCTASAGAFDTASVGTGKTVTATVVLTGTAAGQYVLAATTVTTTANITPAPASVTPNAASKVYGAADPVFTGTLSGFVGADNVTASYSRTAGEGVAASPYTISATLSPAGVLSNYAVTANTANFTITPASASVTPNAASKVYGTADPTFTGTLSGFLPSDGVTATYSRTAGASVAGSPYTISATLSPAGALGNYTITSNTANFTITPAAASVTPNAASKVYGAADPAFTGTLSGFLAADSVTASYSRTTGEGVAGSPYTISATLSPAGVLSNYTVTSSTANFMITPAPATVTPNAASKVYGAADPAFTGTLSGFLPSDGVTATYSRTAGESVAGSPYTISATLSPAGVLSNYTITAGTANFTISKAPVSVTPNAASKVYGAADPAFTGTLSGFLPGDGVTASYSRTAGESVAGSPYTISATLSPAGALSNYTVTSGTANFTISKAPATVAPNAASKVYGTADPAFTGALSGFLPGDGVTATYSRTAGESVVGGPYTISAVLSPAAALANYTIMANTASFTITRIFASLAPHAASKVYGTADPTFTGTLSGFLAGDGVTASYSRVAGENVGGSPYAISAVLSPAGAMGNYTITSNTAGFTITPATPVITWANPADITYPTPLGGTQLNATANVPGTFTYTPSSGTVLSVGNGQLLSVLLTPTDSSNYTTAAAQVHINVLPADVSVNLSTTTAVITAGDNAVYSLVVTSNGQGGASNVVLADTLPAGLNWTVSGPDAAACAPGSPVAGGTMLSCSFGALASGATRAITLTATASVTDCNGISNSATVSATGDTNAGNDSAGPVTITVYCPALAVSKSTPTPTISAGDLAKYNVSVTAGGTGSSTNIVMTDTLPAGYNWTVGGADAASCSPGSPVAGGTTLTCSFGTMESGAARKITLAAVTTAASCGTIYNTAVVTATGDTSLGDNSAGPVPITVYCPDVSVLTSTSTPAINSGGTASYSVVVKGNGPGTANNVTLSDTVPAGLDWTVGGPDGTACLPTSPVTGGMTLTCDFGSLAPGETRTVTLSAVTTAANCGVFKNTATVTAAGDTNPGNNSSGPVAITVSCAPVSVTLSCPNVSLIGAAFVVSGFIAPPSASGVTVQYTAPSGASASHVTLSSAAGNYTDTFTPNEYGPWTVRASWNGAQSPACPVVVYGKSVGGSFVIGDGNAVVGHAADFWGSQWWIDNTWSGGINPGVASLKGFLDAVDLPGNCGGSWSTRPGNSSKPPASIPPYMAVIVTSSISKNGSTIGGDVVGEVIVRTNGGYGPSPGHDGNGTIVAVRCQK